MFSGFEASNNYASGYVGGGYAFGNLHAPGWRVRAVAYGHYHYDGTLFDGSDYRDTTFDGQVGFTAALIGYQIQPGAVTVKLFAGIEAEDQHIVPRDPNAVQGTKVGLRLVAATFLRPSSELIRLDLPTFDRPTKAISGRNSPGNSPGRVERKVRSMFWIFTEPCAAPRLSPVAGVRVIPGDPESRVGTRPRNGAVLGAHGCGCQFLRSDEHRGRMRVAAVEAV